MGVWGAPPRQRQTFPLVAESVSTSLRFFSFFEETESGGDDDSLRSMSIGRPCIVVEFGATTAAAPGSTVMELFRNLGVTAEFSATADPGGAGLWMRHRPNIFFGADDRMSLSIDVTDVPGDIQGYVTVEFLD